MNVAQNGANLDDWSLWSFCGIAVAAVTVTYIIVRIMSRQRPESVIVARDSTVPRNRAQRFLSDSLGTSAMFTKIRVLLSFGEERGLEGAERV